MSDRRVRTAAVLLLALAATPRLAAAQFVLGAGTPPPYVPPPAAATPDPAREYDDASMHFAPPAGWTRVDLPPSDDDSRPSVLFIEPKKNDAASVAITIRQNDGDLQTFENDRDQAIRGGGGLVEKRTETRLANGMPALFVQSSNGASLDSSRRFEYLVVDGLRWIDVALVTRRGTVAADEAMRDLADLSVVLAPRH